jgi:hypothetical protein
MALSLFPFEECAFSFLVFRFDDFSSDIAGFMSLSASSSSSIDAFHSADMIPIACRSDSIVQIDDPNPREALDLIILRRGNENEGPYL